MPYRHAIALTGGIATGKSTAASLLALSGMRTIDADSIAHKLLDDSKEWVANNFGREYLTARGVNRSALGRLIFSDASKKELLERYLHPKIQEEIARQSSKLDRLEFAYLIDIPLFFETKNYPIKQSLVVCAPIEIQLERLMRRNGYSKEEALRRIESQLPCEQKAKMATWVIDNSKDLKHLQQEVERFVASIKKEYGRR